MSEIQTLVFNKHGYNPGNYTYFASQIENGFLPENLVILLEYGVPSSAVKKIQKYVNSNISSEHIIEFLRTKDTKTFDLLPYEEERLRAVLK